MAILEPSLFEDVDDASELVADARAEADVVAGRLVSHEAVSRWLESWGDGAPAPRPKCGEVFGN